MTLQVSAYRQNPDEHGFPLQGAVLNEQVNPRVHTYNPQVLVNINTMKKEGQTMVIRLRDTCTPYPSDQETEGLTNDDTMLQKWRLKKDDHGAARRALYAARMQMA